MLLDGGLPQSAAKIVASLKALEFDPQQITVIGVSHAHFDHAGGVAALQRLTGARVITSRAALPVLSTGLLDEDDPQFGLSLEESAFPAIAGTVAIDDRAEIMAGDASITAVYTPGHTPGGMTWSWRTCEAKRCLDIVYADSVNSVSAPGFRFSDGTAEQVRQSAAVIAGLDCDILLAPHPSFFGMHDKLERGREAFIDDQACRQYAERMLGLLERRLAEEATTAQQPRFPR